MKQNFFSQFALRIASKSPKFWRTLQIIAGCVVAFSWLAQQTIERGFVVIADAAVRERWDKLLGDILLAAAASGGTSLLGTFASSRASFLGDTVLLISIAGSAIEQKTPRPNPAGLTSLSLSEAQ